MNPYISRGPVRDPALFFGRTHELLEIAAFLRGNQSVSIIGPRKIGKTSLLFQLMRPTTWPSLGLDDKNLFVYVDCEVLGDSPHEEIFGLLASEMAATLDERGLPAEPALEAAQNKPGRLSFEAAVRKLNQRGLRVALLLDEFERLSANPNLNLNFFNALRSAAGRYQLVYVTASARPLIELTYSGKSQEILSSPFFNIFAPQFLTALPEADARQLIHEPAARLGSPLPAATADFIWQWAGGHPLALQITCFHALATPEDLEGIERRAMQELNAHFEYYWRNLSPAEQDTLRNVADVARKANTDTTLRAVMRDLVQKSLLIQEAGLYRYASQAWAQFVEAQTAARGATLTGVGGLLTGSRLGQHEVLGSIGRGGMAEVYKGRHTRLDRTVAIKVLAPSLASEMDFQQRFENEARAVAALKHPNIVQIFDFGELEGTFYMVMEYIGGPSLAQYLKEQGALPFHTVTQWVADIAAALDHAHAQGLIHRDVKPSNVMLDTQDPAHYRAVLTDFGIAKLVSRVGAATQTGLVGTLDYMAPEQIRASTDIDARADVYALGVMTYQMLTGRLPFGGDNPGALLMAHLQQPAPDPRLLAPTLPESAAEAITRALHKSPHDRPASAGDLANLLTAGW